MTKRSLGLLVGIPAALLVLFVAAALINTFGARSGTVFAPSYVGSSGDTAVGSPGKDEFYGRGIAGYDMDAAEESMPTMPPTQPSPSAGVTAADVDQKIIKNGYLDLVVDNVDEAVSKTTALVSGKGGFIQTSSVSEREDGTHYGSVTVRIPSSEFEGVMNEVKGYANLVQTQSSTGQDVTEQYTDLQAQLRNAQAQEEEYLQILERAETVEEILMVQSYLGSIRSTIESLQGRLQYLENVTSYSTITVSLSEEPTVRVPTKEFRPGSIANEAVQALVAIVQNLATALIWFVIVGGGILLPTLLIIWVIVLATKKVITRWLK